MSLKKYDKTTGQWKKISSTNAGGSNKASDVSINDVGNHYTATNVESALQEISSKNKETAANINSISATLYEHLNNHPTGGGGPGGPGTMPTIEVEEGFTWTNSDGVSETRIPVFFASPNMGDGTVYILVNNIEVKSAPLPEGASEVVIPPIGSGKGIKVMIYAKDRAGLMSNRVVFTVTSGGIELRIISDTESDYNINNKILFRYQIICSSDDPIYLNMNIAGKDKDGNEIEAIDIKHQSQVGINSLSLPQLDIGIYNIIVNAESGDYKTKEVKFILVVVSSDYIFISSLFDQEAEYEAGIPINVPYRVSIDSKETFNINLYQNDKLQKSLTSKPASLYWTISKLPVGTHTLKIEVSHEGLGLSNFLEIQCKVVQGDYTPVECVQDASLVAWFDATERSNKDSDRELWIDKINGYTGTLHNFNYGSNGWLQQEGKNISNLVLNGTAYVDIDFAPFADNMKNGGAIEVYFRTRDCGNQEARVIDITDVKPPNKGVFISTEKVNFASAAQHIDGAIGENEWIHALINIDRMEGFVHIYINGVSVKQCKLTDKGSGTSAILESIDHAQHIFVGSTKGESNFGMCEVAHIRVYDIPLSMEQCLQNYMSCIDDLVAQKDLYDFNYSDVSLIPTMHITIPDGEYNQNTHEFATMTDVNKVEVSVRYISPNDQLYGSSFEAPKSLMNIQGTSSKGYTYKNFNIQIKDNNRQDIPYSPYTDCVEQSLFCLKCNYMESTNAHNVGIANFVHNELYTRPNPAQQINNKIRSTVEGFPIELYINGVSHGIYDFNLDRYSNTAFGYDLPEIANKCICYEVSANSNNTAGAFVKWTPESGVDERTWYSSSFRGIYPVAKQIAANDNFKEIAELITWVNDSTDEVFMTEFDVHFDRESVIRYYLLVMAFGMVDSLGKNMKLTTFDGVKWYIQVYDCDTSFGLDNTGALKYDVDMEMGDGQFNTDSSRLWVRVRELFAQDLISEYTQMRRTFLTSQTLKKYLFEQNIDKIPHRLYNYSTQKKYLDDNGQWLLCSNGNRYYQLQKWIDERLLYMDTMMQYYASTGTPLTVRTSIEGDIFIDVQTYSPMYVRIIWKNSGDVQAGLTNIKVGRNQTVRMYGRSESKDQEILVYGAHYIKSLGDLSGLAPTHLILDEGDRLTKINCSGNNKLINLKIGKCAYLQEVDISGCSQLGTIGDNQVLDVTGCNNLRKLYADGTKLTSIDTNSNGGNLIDIRLPDTLQSLKLYNQFSLKTLGLPAATDLSNTPENIKSVASKLREVEIINCPSIETFSNAEANINSTGYDLHGRHRTSTQLREAEDRAEFEQALIFGNALANATNVTIENSFLNAKIMSFRCCDNLVVLKLTDLPNLNTLILGENCTGYRWKTDGSVEDLQGAFDINDITIYGCPNLEVFKIHSFSSTRSYFTFSNNILNLAEKFPNLKEFSINIATQGLRDIILPDGVEKLFIKTVTGEDEVDWPHKWRRENCMLKNIYFASDHPDGYSNGIDLGNRQMYEVELSCCPQTPAIKNLNIKNKMLNPIFNKFKGKADQLYPMVAVTGKIDMSEYNESNIEGWFTNMNFDDPDNPVEFIQPNWDELLPKITTVGPMFYHCTNSNFTWEFAMRFFPLIKKSETLHTMYRNAHLKPQVSSTTDAVDMINNYKGVFANWKFNIDPFAETNLTRINKISSSSDCALGDTFKNAASIISINEIELTGEEKGYEFKDAFSGCKSLASIGNIYAPNFSGSCGSMFAECRALYKMGKMTMTCTNFARAFTGCIGLIKIIEENLPDLTGCTDFTSSFSGCFTLNSIEMLSFTNKTPVSSTDSMFAGCKLLSSYKFGCEALPNSVTSAASMFSDTAITQVFPIASGGDDKPLSIASMYRNCKNLTTGYTEIPRRVNNASYLFANSGLTNIDVQFKCKSVDVNHYCYGAAVKNIKMNFSGGTSTPCKVTSMVQLAANCPNLISAEIKMPEQIVIDQVYATGMTYYRMFYFSSKLENVKFDMSAMEDGMIADFGDSFEYCENVKSVTGLDLSHFAITKWGKYLNGYSFYDSHNFNVLHGLTNINLLTTFEVTGALTSSYGFNEFTSMDQVPHIKTVLRHLGSPTGNGPGGKYEVAFGYDVKYYTDPTKVAVELIDPELQQLVQAAENKGWSIVTQLTVPS